MARTSARTCTGCGNDLSPARIAAGKKTCYYCEIRLKREAKQRAHDRRVEQLYGLRLGEYKKLYEAQGGRCAVKGCHARGVTKNLAVDHDHAIGLHDRRAVRGLLCSKHNEWLGQAADDPEVFESVAAYLRDPPARRVLDT